MEPPSMCQWFSVLNPPRRLIWSVHRLALLPSDLDLVALLPEEFHLQWNVWPGRAQSRFLVAFLLPFLKISACFMSDFFSSCLELLDLILEVSFCTLHISYHFAF